MFLGTTTLKNKLRTRIGQLGKALESYLALGCGGLDTSINAIFPQGLCFRTCATKGRLGLCWTDLPGDPRHSFLRRPCPCQTCSSYLQALYEVPSSPTIPASSFIVSNSVTPVHTDKYLRRPSLVLTARSGTMKQQKRNMSFLPLRKTNWKGDRCALVKSWHYRFFLKG